MATSGSENGVATPSARSRRAGRSPNIHSEVSQSEYQDALTVGPDGNLDFAAVDSAEHGCLGTITTAGQITVKPLDFIPRSMVTFDGALWATDVLNIVRIGAGWHDHHLFASRQDLQPPETLEVGNDGNLYVTMLGTTSFAKITSSGTITEYPLPNDSAGNPVRMEDLVEAPMGASGILTTFGRRWVSSI